MELNGFRSYTRSVKTLLFQNHMIVNFSVMKSKRFEQEKSTAKASQKFYS